MNILLEKQARKYLLRLHDPDQSRLEEAIDKLQQLDGNIKHLSGTKNEYRLRVGDYRILFEINDDTITVTKIGPRGDVYK